MYVLKSDTFDKTTCVAAHSGWIIFILYINTRNDMHKNVSNVQQYPFDDRFSVLTTVSKTEGSIQNFRNPSGSRICI